MEGALVYNTALTAHCGEPNTYDMPHQLHEHQHQESSCLGADALVGERFPVSSPSYMPIVGNQNLALVAEVWESINYSNICNQLWGEARRNSLPLVGALKEQ